MSIWFIQQMMLEGNVDGMTGVAGRRASRQAGREGWVGPAFRNSGEQEAKQKGAGDFCRWANRDVGIRAGAETQTQNILSIKNTDERVCIVTIWDTMIGSEVVQRPSRWIYASGIIWFRCATLLLLLLRPHPQTYTQGRSRWGRMERGKAEHNQNRNTTRLPQWHRDIIGLCFSSHIVELLP